MLCSRMHSWDHLNQNYPCLVHQHDDYYLVYSYPFRCLKCCFGAWFESLGCRSSSGSGFSLFPLGGWQSSISAYTRWLKSRCLHLKGRWITARSRLRSTEELSDSTPWRDWPACCVSLEWRLDSATIHATSCVYCRIKMHWFGTHHCQVKLRFPSHLPFNFNDQVAAYFYCYSHWRRSSH